MPKALPASALLEALSDELSPAEILAAKCQAAVAAQIANCRASRRMTQAEFARAMNVTQSTVSKWENGDFNFTLEKLAEIACALDLDLSVSMRTPTDARTAPAAREKLYAIPGLQRLPGLEEG